MPGGGVLMSFYNEASPTSHPHPHMASCCFCYCYIYWQYWIWINNAAHDSDRDYFSL